MTLSIKISSCSKSKCKIRERTGVALAALFLMGGCVEGSGSSGGPQPSPSPTASPTPTPTPAPTPTPTPSASTAAQVAVAMVPGINLGNTLEAVNGSGPFPYSASQEGYWGNPAANQAIFDGYAAAGFKSVRIPVAWQQYASANDTISATWMARVKLVTDYARNAGLIVMINIHWDGGWIDATTAAEPTVKARMTKYWTQIATAFKDYDEHVIFAGTNEILSSITTYATPTASECAIQHGYNQTFVDAVRATGGNNATRPLVFQGYNTNIDHTLLCNATPPSDSASRALMAEVHYYDPYNFTLNANSAIWQWGKDANDPAATETWANEAYADAQFQKMKVNFIDKNIPVILGEYGAYAKPAYPGMITYTRYWDQYITASAFQHGLVPMFWDTGALFNRSTGAQSDPTTIAAIINAAK